MNQSDKDKQSRRRFLSSILKAGVSLPSTWAKAKMDAITNVPAEAKRKTAVSPPGSLSHEHLNSTCTGCQICIQKCPTKVLQPCTSEYDMAGILQPVMDFSKGYCDYDCNICSEVCPAGAITKIDIDTKQNIQIGRAVLTKSICKNATTSSVCTVCADVCPCSAIKIKEDYNSPMVITEDRKFYRMFPVIEDVLCIGCGKCENLCPSEGARAIHVEGLAEHTE